MTSTLTWKLGDSEKGFPLTVKEGSLKARAYLADESPPPTPSQTTAQFQVRPKPACLKFTVELQVDPGTMSNATVTLGQTDLYQISLIRKKLLAGKYFVDPQVRH